MTDGCSCAKCVACCERSPGWMTPDDARRAIAAGYARTLMLDYWTQDASPVCVLCPAVAGYEARRAPNSSELLALSFDSGLPLLRGKGPCTLLVDAKCAIHTSGFKPLQCRASYACRDYEREPVQGDAIKDLWATDEARALVADWMRLVGLDAAVLEDCY